MKIIARPFLSAARHSGLLREFVRRDVTDRFAGSVAGTFWTLIHPLTNIIIYIMIFSVILKVSVTVGETGTDNFGIYFLTGFFPWILLADNLTRATGVLVDNANLITKVVFPIELLPLGSCIAVFITNGFGFLLLFGYLAFMGYFGLTWVYVFVLLPLQLIFVLGIAYLLSAACVFIRDTGEMVGIAVMVWFYSTPIIYPSSMVPDSLKTILTLNPMSMFIQLYRDAVLVHRVDFMLLMWAVLISFVTYGVGCWFFMRLRPAFGDVL